MSLSLHPVFGAFALVASCVLVSSQCRADDWPRWRGVNSDGISAETGWKASFPADGPKVLWKLNVGIGCSSFSVVGDQVFTMGNEKTDKDNGTIFCLNARNGEALWRQSFPSPLDPKYFDGGQLSTPTVDGDLVYAVGRQGQLFAMKRATGAIVWQKHMVTDLGGRMPTWGYAGSPVVVGEKLLLDLGGQGASAMALHKETGKTIWKSGNDIAGYGTPFIFQEHNQPVAAIFTGVGLVLREVANGNEVARFPWKTSYDINPTTPIIAGDRIFISSGYGHGGALLKLDGRNLSKLWDTKSMRTKMNSCVLWKGHLYGFDEGELTCMIFETGTVKWKEKSFGMGALTLADGKLIVLGEGGDLAMVEATPTAYKPLARAHVLTKTCWTSPILANGRIFCRNNAGDVVCVDVSGK